MAFADLSPGGARAWLWLLTLCFWLPSLHAQEADSGKPLQVLIQGLDEDEDQDSALLNNIRVYLGIWELDGEIVTSPFRLRWLHANAEEEIRRALQPFGFYRPDIEAELEETPDRWVARYRIEPNDPIRISDLTVAIEGEARQDPAYQRLLERLPLREGGVLVHPRYEDIKQGLQSLAAERGYFEADLTASTIRVDMQNYAATVTLRFDSGPRYQFGQANFQQDTFAPEFLERFVPFEPGEAFQVDELLALQSALVSSEYFARVEVSAPPDAAQDQTVPVNVALEPRKPRKYTFSIGYGTDTGPRGKAGVEGRYINRWGHKYEAELLASLIRYEASARYIIPGKDPLTDQFTLGLAVADEDSDTRNFTNATLVGAWTRYADGWQKTYSLNYLFERFSFGDEERDVTLFYPGVNWTRVSVADRLNVTDGYRLTLDAKGSYEGLLSDVSFVQGSIRGKWIKSFSERDRLILRGDLGGTSVYQGGFNDLPASLRFFAGGDQSVRGYEYDSIGPRNNDGEVIGGKFLTVGSLEYEHRFREKWAVAAFVDSGDAYSSDGPEFKTGAGLGVRWLSPVGPVRVDLAHGFDDPGDTVRLHLTIGPDL
ncbi:MAG: autotransporter assembly complex family protein [Candidatus Competibacteraceae bacterium]|nr:autotransporter assembly complex family protein [Candidatus Competibacteraceae bacterium]